MSANLIEVCIMNHLSDLRNDWILYCEPQAERLKSAQITIMGKIGFKHVEAHGVAALGFL